MEPPLAVYRRAIKTAAQSSVMTLSDLGHFLLSAYQSVYLSVSLSTKLLIGNFCDVLLSLPDCCSLSVSAQVANKRLHRYNSVNMYYGAPYRSDYISMTLTLTSDLERCNGAQGSRSPPPQFNYAVRCLLLQMNSASFVR